MRIIDCFLKSVLVSFLSFSFISCATNSSETIVIGDGLMEEPVRIEVGSDYDQVINLLEQRKISYSDPRENPFFIPVAGESKVIVVLVNSHDSNRTVNGSVSYRLSFDGSGVLFASKKSYAIDKE